MSNLPHIDAPKFPDSYYGDLKLSFSSFEAWAQKNEGVIRSVVPNRDYIGTILMTDGLHALQRIWKNVFAIHRTMNLEKSPIEGDQVTIRYGTDGQGKVTFRDLGRNRDGIQL